MKRIRLFLRLCPLFVLVSCILSVSIASGSEITAFGPKKYIRTTGAPNIYKDTFAAEPGEAWLIIRNGLEGQKSNKDQRVTSGKVSLNGTVLFTHQDFKHQTYILETPISLADSNQLRVELESKPDSFLVIEIIQTIVDPIKDLSATGLTGDTSACPEYIDLTVQITNLGDAEIPAGVPVSFYNGNPEDGGQFIGKIDSSAILLPTKSESISYRWNNPPSGEAVLFARVDDDGSGVGLYEEVDELNNITSAEVILCQEPPPGESSIAGKVIDAVSGAYLSDIHLLLRLDDNGLPGTAVATMQSDANGAFLFAGLAARKYHITAAHEGYIDSSKTVTLAENVNLTDQDLVLSPVLADNQIRIVLTWNANPADLEAHITQPSDLGCRYHCYYFNKNIPTANLDLDDRNGYGPETITITDKITGTYRYYVHDFTNRYATYSRWLSLSGAQVKIYSGNREPIVFNVPSGYGNVWHVFDMDGQTGEITPVNFMSNQSEPGKIDYPVIVSNPVSYAYWDTPYAYQVKAIDPDNDPLLYELEKAPEGMTIDASTGLIQWRPSGTQSGWYQVVVKVTDGRCGEVTQTFNVHVYSQPTAQFSVDPCSGVNPDGNITLNWSTTLAATVLIEPGIGEVPKSGSLTIPSPTEPTVYTLTAFNDAALTKRTVPGWPSASFYFSPSTIYRGQETRLYWYPYCAADAEIDHGIGKVTGSGSMILKPTVSSYYYLKASNAYQTSNYAAYINVLEPKLDFWASPTCNFTPGQALTLMWDTHGGSDVSITPDVGPVASSGSTVVYPQAPNQYILTASFGSDKLTAIAKYPEEAYISFYPDRYQIGLGESVTLRWSAPCADTVSIDNGIGDKPTSGSVIVTPDRLPITYKLTATNEAGSKYGYVTINLSRPIVTMRSTPVPPIGLGDSVTLSWTSKYADTLIMNQGVGEIAANGELVVTPESLPQYYTITATNAAGTTTANVYLYQRSPTGTFSATPDVLKVGDSTTLSWTSSDATSCIITPDIGVVDCNGSKTITPIQPTNYRLQLTGPGGTVYRYAYVTFVAPVADLKASATTIKQGESVKLTWVYANATSCVIDQNIGPVELGGEITVTPSVTTTYTMTSTGPGGVAKDSVTITVLPGNPPPTVSLSAQENIIIRGNSTTLSWTSSYADSVSIAPGIGPVATSGSVTVSPEVTTTYTATATGPGGTTTATRTITVVQQAPTLTLQATPTTIMNGESAQLTWSSTYADKVVFNQGIGTVGIEGTLTVSPSQTTTYIATATGPGGTITKNVTITVNQPKPTVTFTAEPLTIIEGESTQLNWTTTNAVTVAINPGIGTVATAGNLSVSPTEDITYTLAATGPGGTTEANVAITVIPKLILKMDSPVAGELLANPTVKVSGQVTAGATVTVNGTPATVVGNVFTAEVVLTSEGENSLLVEASDLFGQHETVTATVLYFAIPTVTITADKHRSFSGETVTLTWTSENCTGASIEPDLNQVDCNGTAMVSPTATKEYVISVTGNAEKTARASVVIVVDDPYGDPTPEEQAHLEAINRARANPPAEAARMNIDLNEGPPETYISDQPLPPLKFNTKLTKAARGHSQDMVNNHYFAHEGSDGSTPAERCLAEGYVGGTGENIAARMASTPMDSYETSLALHDQLFLDKDYPGRGHRVNILGQTWTEIGIGYIHESIKAELPYGGVVTCNFGDNKDVGYVLLGTVYEDADADQVYDSGEGVASALIRDLVSGAQVYSASAGGYSLPLTSGEHTIQVTLPDGRTLNRQLTMAGANIKLDFRVAMFADTKPMVQLTSRDQAIRPGQTTQLTWQTTDAEYAAIDNGVGYLPANGSVVVAPAQTTTYTITATGKGGTATATVTVYVSDFAQPPTVNVSASPTTIAKGQTTTLSWTSVDAQHVHIDNGVGDVDLNGSLQLAPEHSTTYTLTATSPGGVASTKIRILVTGNPTLQPAGSFGALYNSRIPADATVENYDPERFALATGEVKNLSGNPLANVAVTVLDHPEYGTVATDADGKFILPVEGGTTLTLMYHLDSYLPAQRQVHVPVNDIGIAETVQLLQQDNRATEVKLDGKPGTVITHRSTSVSDASGTRALTMVFQGDTRAYAVDDQGKTIRELTSFTVRATEYQTTAAMPAELPKTSAYTYCAELQVDGVDRARFSKPVVTWVDNFLGFKVGMEIPVGHYDRDKGIWIATKNGIVVTLLDTNGDGVVDGVDKDGDGQPDDLNGNGSVKDEAIGLGDSQMYRAGSTYWRMELDHFSPGDFNLCSFFKLLNMFGYDIARLLEQFCPDGKCPTGSAVGNESRIFYEDIAISGTSLSLAYASDRTEGFKNVISVPVSGVFVPESVKRIEVEANIAGRKYTKTLQPLPDQITEFVWDGRDLLNNRILHKVTAQVSIGYVYDSSYMESGFMQMAFGQFGTTVSEVPTRNEMVNWRRSEVVINPAEKGHGLAQGWSISAHHKLSPTDPTTLHKGDGPAIRNNTAFIATIAGTGEEGWAVDGAMAKETPLSSPVSTVLDAEGNIYVANQVYAAILKIDKAGRVEIVAGGPYGTRDEDNIDAKEARIHTPNDLAVDSRGNLYIADAGSNKIREIDTNGIITTIAGNGNQESSGDDGPALLAGIMPSSIAVDDAGNVYFAEASSCVGGEVDPVTGQCTGGTIVESSYRVRKISTDGLIRTIVGTGEKSDGLSNGDGGPASEALLQNPSSVSVDHDGNLYIADGSRIRKVNASGTITTVAGNGFSGYSGDGGLATMARITHAQGITFDGRGNFYFSQFYGNGDVIRKVSADGLISTVAGKGAPGMAGENGAATKAQLMQPHRLSIDAQGFVIIPDRGNKLVRKVSVKSYDQKEVHFTENNGLGHLIAADGKHSLTYDLETGVPLLEFGYDPDDRLTSITDQFSNVVTIEYMLGVPSAIVSPDGLRTKLTIDDYHQLKAITYPDGHAFTFEYAKNDGLITAKNEPNGNRFEHFFDETGRVTKTNNQEQGLWQFSREAKADGQVTSTMTTPNTTTTVKRRPKSTGAMESTVTAASGEVGTTTTSTDGLDSTTTSSCGMQVKTASDLDPWFDHTSVKSTTVTTPAGLTLTASIDTAYVDNNNDGQFESVTHTATANGKAATVKHDVVNAARTVTSPEGRTITSNYDPNTLQTTTTTVPGLLAVKYGYRTDGKLSSVTSGTRTIGYTYDTAGNLATITDPLSRFTKFTDYDAAGRLKRVERADTSVIQYDYDENGNMTLYRTPLVADNNFAYNGVNKAESFTTPLGSTTSYAYNAERQLAKVTLPSTKTIVNTYANGRLTETATPEWTNTYAYSCGELLDSITRGAEKLAYSYDGELVTGIAQSGTLAAGIGLTYNSDFQLDSITYAGATEELAYDKDGLLINSGGFAIGRRSDNGLPETVIGGNFTLTRTFNGYGEVEKADTAVSGSVFRYDLTRNADGRIKTKTETVAGTSSVFNYTYDPIGRLRTVTKDSTLVEEYRYDKNGNRTYQLNTALGITDRTFSHSVEDHTLTAGPITYQFDHDDNLSARTENGEITEYVYSSTGELRSVKLPEGTVISYVHDPLGRRIAKKANGTIVEKYLWSGQTTLLAVYDGYDVLRQRFEYADGRLPFAMTAGGAVYYLAYDQVGTLRLVTDSSGNTVKSIDYDTFGNIVSDSNPSFTIPFGFAGGLHDRDTKLVRFGYRDYLPEIGKWTAKDPILFAGGDSNLFGYVQNDPVNFFDPEGLMSAGQLGIGNPGSYGGENTCESMYDDNSEAPYLEGYIPMEMTLGAIEPFGIGKLLNINKIAQGANIRKLEQLIEKWGGRGKDWKKMKGWDKNGQEWHWYQKRGDGTKYGIKQKGDLDPF